MLAVDHSNGASCLINRWTLQMTGNRNWLYSLSCGNLLLLSTRVAYKNYSCHLSFSVLLEARTGPLHSINLACLSCHADEWLPIKLYSSLIPAYMYCVDCILEGKYLGTISEMHSKFSTVFGNQSHCCQLAMHILKIRLFSPKLMVVALIAFLSFVK